MPCFLKLDTNMCPIIEVIRNVTDKEDDITTTICYVSVSRVLGSLNYLRLRHTCVGNSV